MNMDITESHGGSQALNAEKGRKKRGVERSRKNLDLIAAISSPPPC